jgi:hypothetical protein
MLQLHAFVCILKEETVRERIFSLGFTVQRGKMDRSIINNKAGVV